MNNSTLFELKNEFNLPSAADYLSKTFGEMVSETDIFQFALGGHLKLSVNLISPIMSRRGVVVSGNQIKWADIPADMARDQFSKIPIGLELDFDRYINFDVYATTLRGLYDLPMIGSERQNIEHKRLGLTGLPPATTQDKRGAFVEDEWGNIFQLLVRYDDVTIPMASFCWLYQKMLMGEIESRGFCTTQLPDCPLLIRKSALIAFVNKQQPDIPLESEHALPVSIELEAISPMAIKPESASFSRMSRYNHLVELTIQEFIEDNQYIPQDVNEIFNRLIQKSPRDYIVKKLDKDNIIIDGEKWPVTGLKKAIKRGLDNWAKKNWRI